MNQKVEQRMCGSRTRSGGVCQLHALPGKTRCHFHGAAGGRPSGIPEHPNSKAARLEGRRRWCEHMRAAKARGEISRFPGGRRARDLPPLSKDPTIRRAQRIIEAAMAERELVAVPDRPWSELTHPEKLDRETGTALDVAAKILHDGAKMLDRDGLEGMDIKLLALVKDTAMQIIANQIRVDTAVLAAPKSELPQLDLDQHIANLNRRRLANDG